MQITENVEKLCDKVSRAMDGRCQVIIKRDGIQFSKNDIFVFVREKENTMGLEVVIECTYGTRTETKTLDGSVKGFSADDLRRVIQLVHEKAKRGVTPDELKQVRDSLCTYIRNNTSYLTWEIYKLPYDVMQMSTLGVEITFNKDSIKIRNCVEWHDTEHTYTTAKEDILKSTLKLLLEAFSAVYLKTPYAEGAKIYTVLENLRKDLGV